MSSSYSPKFVPPFEVTEQLPTHTATKVKMIQATVEAGKINVEPTVRKTCKMMCVTTNTAVLVIAWTVASVYFSGLSAYWLLTTLPAFRFNEYLILYYYPMSATIVIVLLLSPVFAVAGDVRCGNLRSLVSGVIPLNVCGLISAVILTVTFAVVGAVIISYFMVVGYILLFLAGGIFQANAIQFGRDVLGDFNSPERSAFVHWYYWATYVPTFAAAVILCASHLTYSPIAYVLLSVVLLMAMVTLMIFLLVTCVVHCVRSKSTNQNTSLPPIKENPVTQVFRVTRLALESPSSPVHHGFLARLNKTRQSNGGPIDDEEVDNVANFWLLVLLMVSLYGFFFWDDMWAMPFATAIIDGSNPIVWSLSSQATTAVVVFISVPIYQLVVRPLLGKHSPPLLWRILAGLILQLISLIFVTWNSGTITAQFGSEVLSDVCNFNFANDVSNSNAHVGEGISWYILVIPQVINGISQLLVFPAVIELILTDAPRVMQGLLVGLWYAMQSIHVLVGVIEAATCVVYYWQYYLVKIVLVLVSSITFRIIASFYKRTRGARNERNIYWQLQESSNVQRI